jgi:hypothetical protein
MQTKVRISQADLAGKSDDWFTGFEAGSLAGIEAERERCAKLIEETYVNDFPPAPPWLRQAIVAAIRA